MIIQLHVNIPLKQHLLLITYTYTLTTSCFLIIAAAIIQGTHSGFGVFTLVPFATTEPNHRAEFPARQFQFPHFQADSVQRWGTFLVQLARLR